MAVLFVNWTLVNRDADRGSMPNLQQAISLFLVSTLVVSTAGLEGCSKKSSESGQTGQEGQAPATTYATPTADQLSQLVAPIALFPDNLLAQVLAASTYPDQVTAAHQWLQQNSSLKGAELMQTVDQQPWDASVKGLTQFPDVLQQMASNLSWTSSLGDAYFNIPQSVMNAVQVMRQRAYDAGNLKSGPQQNITVEKNAPASQSAPPAPAPASSGQPQVTVVQSPPQTIVIQPAQPEVVYVPTYNPTAVYGAPVPPPPGYSTGEMVATSLLSFGVGIAVGAAISGGGCCGWGYNSWGCGWNNSTVVYNRNTYVSTSNTFVNRNNYYNRNVNNANINNANLNNVNRNNVNANNVNRNNLNTNNVNRGQLNNANNRTNNFNNDRSTPQFSQQRNQQQFRNENAGNLGQERGNGQPRASGQPNFNQQNRGELQTQNRPGKPSSQSIPAADRQADRGSGQQMNRDAGNRGTNNLNQSQRQPERGYGDQANRDSGSGAFSNYGQGGNTRTNSARGQQSLEGRGGSGSADRSGARATGNSGSSGGRSGARGSGGGGGRRR